MNLLFLGLHIALLIFTWFMGLKTGELKRDTKEIKKRIVILQRLEKEALAVVIPPKSASKKARDAARQKLLILKGKGHVLSELAGR